MCYEIKIETVVAIVAVVVAIVAVYYGNKNSKQQILITKLEELFEVVQSLSRYYGRLMELNFKVEELRDSENKELQTLAQYYEIRDQKISKEERLRISEYLSRIEVLTECYTKGDLKKQLLHFEKLMYSFSDLVFNGGSIHQELNFKKGFPNYEEFNTLIKELKQRIITEIKM
ncbi:hypothetical protein HQ489_04645 [Candidatus Woesearchaeota archaeon]|nr:hypothetical protein [Candidatus Woesearchaeota archaeon]